jgi:hypothetical protein
MYRLTVNGGVFAREQIADTITGQSSRLWGKYA